jgi:hypothetical protein
MQMNFDLLSFLTYMWEIIICQHVQDSSRNSSRCPLCSLTDVLEVTAWTFVVRREGPAQHSRQELLILTWT